MHEVSPQSGEGEDVRDEAMSVVVELVCQIVKVLGQVHLLCCLERGVGLLVHLPDLDVSMIRFCADMDSSASISSVKVLGEKTQAVQLPLGFVPNA